VSFVVIARTVAPALMWLAATVVVLARGPQATPPQAAAPPASQQAAPPAPASATQSILDGVFTDEQAKRGQDIYTAICAHCHGNSLEGGIEAPPLTGASFIKNWSGSTVGDLIERTRRSMPDDDPASLTRQEYTDVITFVLGSNHYPTGKTELPIETDKQKLIKLEPLK
jgi:mono/diheme cytochrome c family protein